MAVCLLTVLGYVHCLVWFVPHCVEHVLLSLGYQFMIFELSLHMPWRYKSKVHILELRRIDWLLVNELLDSFDVIGAHDSNRLVQCQILARLSVVGYPSLPISGRGRCNPHHAVPYQRLLHILGLLQASHLHLILDS